MSNISLLLDGFAVALSLQNVALCFLGCLVGTLIGGGAGALLGREIDKSSSRCR